MNNIPSPGRYQSRFGADKEISASQFIAEMVCEKMAIKEGHPLPKKFWNNNDKWHKLFINQVFAASSLLRIYPAHIVISCLRKQKFIYSLRQKNFMEKLMDENKLYLENLKKIMDAPKVEVSDKIEKPRELFEDKKPSIMDKLRNLE